MVKGSAAILAYHRVIELPRDPQQLTVTPANFADQMRHVSQHFQPITLAQLLDGLTSDTLPARAVVVTFDDGYADFAANAVPVLQHFRIPVTLFVATGRWRLAEDFWWDELERMLLDRPVPDYAQYRKLMRVLRNLPVADRNKVLEQLRAEHEVRDVHACHPALSADQVRALGAGPGIEIGAHTINHPRLSSLNTRQQIREVRGSIRVLEKTIGLDVDTFAYPYGMSRDYNRTTVRILKAAGIRAACTTERGVVKRGTNPYQLPRIVVRDGDAAQFARNLPW